MEAHTSTFVDHYELMQISPNAERETIQRVYRMLAARFHPDNPETGDMAKFIRLNEAYQTLVDIPARAAYDAIYQTRRFEPIGVFGLKEFDIGIDGEASRRMGILCLLYSRRRSEPERPGLSVLHLERVMAFPREHLMFTLWYLKEKELVSQNEHSDFVITGKGVDYVEENLPGNKVLYRLLKAAETGAARDAAPAPWSAGFGGEESEHEKDSRGPIRTSYESVSL
jgi:curved DNA-binding protein CbpA